MRRLLSFCLVLCVSLSLSIGFSVTANAETITGHKIRQDVYLIDKDGDILWEDFHEFTPNNNDQEKYEVEFDECTASQLRGMEVFHRTVWNIFQPSTGYPFVVKKVNKVTLENFYYRYLMDDNGLHYVSQYNDVYVIMTYADNTTERIEVEVYADTDLGLDINFEFTPTKNVSRLDLYLDSPLYEYIRTPYGSDQITITNYLGEIKGDDKYNFTIDFQSEEAGLLSGLIVWVKKIHETITNIPNMLIDLGEKIANLPVLIWETISDGLTYLFTPPIEEMTAVRDQFDQMLENKLGALYQIGDVLIEGLQGITTADKQGTITIPTAQIRLPGGRHFVFGGYNVDVVPKGFEFFETTVELAVGLVATLAFANGIRKRYDEFVR